jgi:tetratricopeptide (TPR) repeat protein
VGGLTVGLLAGCGAGPPAPSTPAGAVSHALDRARQAEASGNLSSAVSEYQKAVALDPHNEIAWFNLGVIAQERSQNTQALADYKQAVAANPRFVSALYNLALLETVRSPKDAVSDYERVVTIQPSYAAAHLNLGYLLKQMGHTQQGDAEIAKAIALEPALGRPAPTTTVK